MAWKERYSRSCCPPIFFDRKAWDGALACADVLLALVKEPCLQCLGLGLLVMLQGRYWIDQFRRVIGAQTDSAAPTGSRSEEHTSELQSLMRISYAVFCLKKKNYPNTVLKCLHYTGLLYISYT